MEALSIGTAKDQGTLSVVDSIRRHFGSESLSRTEGWRRAINTAFPLCARRTEGIRDSLENYDRARSRVRETSPRRARPPLAFRVHDLDVLSLVSLRALVLR